MLADFDLLTFMALLNLNSYVSRCELENDNFKKKSIYMCSYI